MNDPKINEMSERGAPAGAEGALVPPPSLGGQYLYLMAAALRSRTFDPQLLTNRVFLAASAIVRHQIMCYT